MTWQFSILLFYVFSVSQSLQRRAYSQKSTIDSKVVVALSYITGVLPLGIIVGLGTRDLGIDWSGITIPVLLIMGLFIALFNSLAFDSSKQLSAATFQTIFQIYPVVVAVGGWLLLDEALTTKQVAGGALLIIGAILAAQSYKNGKPTKLISPAVLLAVLASISLGIGIIAEKEALAHMTLGTYFVIGYAVQTLATIIIARKPLLQMNYKSISKSEWINIIILGVLSSMIGFFYIYAINTADNVGLVSLVTTFQLPLTALAGYFILKEKEVGWKLALGIMVASVGLIFTAV